MTKYEVKYSSEFKMSLKKCLKQGKDINKMMEVVEKFANLEKLEPKYRDHKLNDSKYYKDCGESM